MSTQKRSRYSLSERLWRDRKGYPTDLDYRGILGSCDRLFSLSTIAGQWEFFYAQKEF